MKVLIDDVNLTDNTEEIIHVDNNNYAKMYAKSYYWHTNRNMYIAA